MSDDTRSEREKLEAQMRALQSDLEPIEAERRERAELEAMRREVERLTNAKRDAPAIADAEIKHGAIGRMIEVVETDLGAIIVKRPQPMVYKRFQDRGDYKTEAVEQLVRPCVVYPDRDRLNVILDEQPAVLADLANACAKLAGNKTKEQSGKS